MTTATATIDQATTTATEKAKRKNSRTKKHYEFGSVVADLIKPIFPGRTGYRDTIAATCLFELRGRGSNGNTYGLGFITRAKTYGEIPIGCVPAGDRLAGYFPCQMNSGWMELTDNDAANIILECFGLTDQDVIDEFGRPENGERYQVSLMEVVETLAPQHMPVGQAHVDATLELARSCGLVG